jgi:hypothetical protein
VAAALSWNELGDTLIELTAAVAPDDSTGLIVTGAELTVPLEVRLARTDGRLVLLAQPPFTRWRSGFLPTTHQASFSVGPRSGDGW